LSNLKPLLARGWAFLHQLDSRLTKSAFAGAGLSIVTGLLIGAFNGCFNPDDKKDDGGLKIASRAQYAVFAPQFACVEDKHLALEATMVGRVPQTRGRLPTDDERVQAIVVLADYGRGARQNAAEMSRLLTGIRPPAQFTNDHQELVDTADLLRKLVDELDRDLPANMSLAPAAILSDPTLNDRLVRLMQTATATGQALARREFSQDFRTIYTCPNPLPRPTATRIPITIAFPTVSIPPILLSPFPTLQPFPPPLRTPTPVPPGSATPTTFDITSPSPTPFRFGSLVTPGNPFSSFLTPVR
jgi:hypothetical protein